jgi:hypothetical protein
LRKSGCPFWCSILFKCLTPDLYPVSHYFTVFLSNEALFHILNLMFFMPHVNLFLCHERWMLKSSFLHDLKLIHNTVCVFIILRACYFSCYCPFKSLFKILLTILRRLKLPAFGELLCLLDPSRGPVRLDVHEHLLTLFVL